MLIFERDVNEEGKQQNFTQVSNYIVRDKNIKPKVKLVLIYILGCDKTWRISKPVVMKYMGMTEKVVDDAFKFLFDNGFLERLDRVHKNGKFSHYNYRVVERPVGYTPNIEKSEDDDEPFGT